MINFIKKIQFIHKKELQRLKAGRKFINLEADQFAIVDDGYYYIYEGLTSLDKTLSAFIDDHDYDVIYCMNNTYLLEST